MNPVSAADAAGLGFISRAVYGPDRCGTCSSSRENHRGVPGRPQSVFAEAIPAKLIGGSPGAEKGIIEEEPVERGFGRALREPTRRGELIRGAICGQYSGCSVVPDVFVEAHVFLWLS
eukprot:tig00000449_g946.t1